MNRSHVFRALLLAALAVLLAVPVRAAKKEVPYYATVEATGGLNVRAKRRDSAKILATLRQGTLVNVIDLHGKWAKIEFEGGTGYARKSDLKALAKDVTAGFQGQEADEEQTPFYYRPDAFGDRRFIDRTGEVRYRAYGFLNGAPAAWYASDDGGEVSIYAEPVDLDQELRSLAPLLFVSRTPPDAALNRIEAAGKRTQTHYSNPDGGTYETYEVRSVFAQNAAFGWAFGYFSNADADDPEAQTLGWYPVLEASGVLPNGKPLTGKTLVLRCVWDGVAEENRPESVAAYLLRGKYAPEHEQTASPTTIPEEETMVVFEETGDMILLDAQGAWTGVFSNLESGYIYRLRIGGVPGQGLECLLYQDAGLYTQAMAIFSEPD